MRILYVEDEKFLAEAVKHNLEKQQIAVDVARDGEAGLNAATKDIYDCVILDIMLPKVSGIEILQHIRSKGVKTPVIMLSALSEVDDKVKGLNLGADDYLAKPFKTTELIARIHAVVRRPAEIQDQETRYSDLCYNITNKELNGTRLTAKESGIMAELIKTPEKVVKKDFLLNKIWGNTLIAEDNYIEVYISHLRKKLKELKSKVKITTVRGFGYKLTTS
ncbi:MAG: response regulator transcription factor [Candidatus Nomurabacteria bacterium]|jgi:DNA-binding response OmpR family regulator|nr:response regulator transcription factor [Candidatus Nomurabacteria bacterium]